MGRRKRPLAGVLSQRSRSVSFVGQGADKTVFDKTYDSIVKFTEELNAFAKGEKDKTETVDAILAKISEL